MDNSTRKILIIEDDQFLREFYQELLTGEGFLVEASNDGEKGLQRIREGQYDLILLDIMLPKKDGLSVLRDLKISRGNLKASPIVILTNLGQDTIIRQAFDLGAAGYLIKSAFSPDQVLAEIKSYLQKS